MEASIDALVGEVLLPLNPTADQRSTAWALAAARFWPALCGSGLNREQVRATAARLLRCALEVR